jgi:hypothetical protein
MKILYHIKEQLKDYKNTNLLENFRFLHSFSYSMIYIKYIEDNVTFFGQFETRHVKITVS